MVGKRATLGAAYAARVSPLIAQRGSGSGLSSNRTADKAECDVLDPANRQRSRFESSRHAFVGGSGGREQARRARPTARSSVPWHRLAATRGRSSTRWSPTTLPMYTTGALRAALEKAGHDRSMDRRVIGCDAGNATSKSRRFSSPPLAQIIGEMDRESINICAELLFRATRHAALNHDGRLGGKAGLTQPARASCRTKVGAKANGGRT